MRVAAAFALFVFLFVLDVLSQDTCIKYGSCAACSNSGERCGWCASDSYGGGSCLSYDGTGAPVGSCASEYWRKACCSVYDSCDDCANSGDRCQWCEYGSNVNGGQCIPKDGQGYPALGGCESGYYTNWCCRDYHSCDDCLGFDGRCKWCGEGSSTNPGQCLPYDGTGNPMYGGCESNYYDSYCCMDFTDCVDCIEGGRCGWCGNTTVNAYTCLERNGQGYPMNGGCSSFYSNTDKCPKQLCPPNCIACDNPSSCTKCIPGYTNNTCNETCSVNCDSLGGCDINTGECFGCQNGTQCGFSCEETCLISYYGCQYCTQNCTSCFECEPGLYGEHCTDVCDGCLFFQCDTTGLCSSGCASGFSGSHCTSNCTETCGTNQICATDGCQCSAGYVQDSNGNCIQADLGISCDTCEKLVSAAHLAVSVGKSYETLAEAEAALEEIGCFFLPPPLDLGCALVISQEGLLYTIAQQASDALLEEGFCEVWGAC